MKRDSSSSTEDDQLNLLQQPQLEAKRRRRDDPQQQPPRVELALFPQEPLSPKAPPLPLQLPDLNDDDLSEAPPPFPLELPDLSASIAHPLPLPLPLSPPPENLEHDHVPPLMQPPSDYDDDDSSDDDYWTDWDDYDILPWPPPAQTGGGEGRSLEETPTWAVAVVCLVLVSISIFIEQIIHFVGKWLRRKNKNALYEALERIKSELMLLGFISLLLTVIKGRISEICVSKAVGNSWLPCNRKFEEKAEEEYDDDKGHRRLLSFLDFGTTHQRSLAAGAYEDKCAAKGKVHLLSEDGIHQLHIFIFTLAVFHVLYCIITLALGRAKMSKWKAWEKETKTVEYQFSHDPERLRFARDTSFGRRHLKFWCRSPILIWTVCFFRQFVRSVPKVDYSTLRHGFITAHLAPQSQINFDFQKYINRSLENDFKVVVGISPPIWFLAVLFLLFNTKGIKSFWWLSFIPLILVLLVGTKLQVIITKMGLRIQERGEVVQGTPVVQPADDLFWFNRPGLLLYLIHFVLFQNAFQLAFFAWAWYEFGTRSCFHEKTQDVVSRISMGIIVQILCSYVTLPLYALVTQMGSTMKPAIFNDRVAKALHSWQQDAKKNIKNNRHPASVTPSPNMPSTPWPNIQTCCQESKTDSVRFTNVHFPANGSESFSPNHKILDDKVPEVPEELREFQEPNSSSGAKGPTFEHQIDMYSGELSFNQSSER